MEWRDEGTVIGVRRHGETAVVLELMTREHGRHRGLVHGGRSRKKQPVLQLGNRVVASWRGRLDEHLGTFAVEPVMLRAGELMERPLSLHGVQAASALLRLLPEREAHPRLAEGLDVLLGNLRDPEVAGPLMVRFEAQVLDELGYGLDLSRCAATGRTGDLTHVSPKTGRAVCREAAAPYADRLLELPSFLTHRPGDNRAGSLGDILAGFALTGHFLDRLRDESGIERPEGALDPRAAFIDAVRRGLGSERTAGGPTAPQRTHAFA